MEFEEYESINALNWSSLKHMAVSPMAYRWALDHPRKDTPALLLGRAVHCAVLEPEVYRDRYLVPEEKRCATTKKDGERCSHSALPFADHCGVHKGQAEADAFAADHPGVEVLTADQGETVEACVASVRAHHDVSDLLEGCTTEQVVTWTDPGTGVACKGRIDALTPRTVIDLKTTRELARFEQDAARLLYHAQVAWYLDGARAAGVVDPSARAWIVAVETVGPYDCGPLEVAGADLDAGREVYRRLLDTWVSCRDTGDWYGRIPVGRRLELPRWAPGFEPEEVSL